MEPRHSVGGHRWAPSIRPLASIIAAFDDSPLQMDSQQAGGAGRPFSLPEAEGLVQDRVAAALPQADRCGWGGLGRWSGTRLDPTRLHSLICSSQACTPCSPLGRLRLAATCRALRSTSLRWFPEIWAKLALRDSAAGASLAAWLCRYQGGRQQASAPAAIWPEQCACHQCCNMGLIQFVSPASPHLAMQPALT